MMLEEISALYTLFFAQTNRPPNLLILDHESYCRFVIELRDQFPGIKSADKYHEMTVYQVKSNETTIKVAYELGGVSKNDE